MSNVNQKTTNHTCYYRAKRHDQEKLDSLYDIPQCNISNRLTTALKQDKISKKRRLKLELMKM